MSIRRYSFVLVLAVILCSVGLAVAGDQDRDRLKDGSCQDDAIEDGVWEIVASDQIRTRSQDRTRDHEILPSFPAARTVTATA